MARVRHLRTRAFTLIELLLVVVIIALLISILLPSLAGARKAARTGICQANMRMFNMGFQNYSGDAKGLIASFSWQPRVRTPSDYNDNRITPTSATQAHARQGVEIVRSLGRDPTLVTPSNLADNRILARNFTQIVLMHGGYYGDRNPEPAAACSEDRELIQWQRLTPQQAQSQLPGWDFGAPPAFAPYYSSYQIVPAAFQAEKDPGQIYHVPTDHRLYYVSPATTRFRQIRLDEVAVPSQKVVWFDMFDRHSYKRPIYYAYSIAKQPLAFFDGSVVMRATRDANPGWQNNNRNSITPAYITYSPKNKYEPAALYTVASQNRLPAYFRWTRSALRGVDFGGKEVKR